MNSCTRQACGKRFVIPGATLFSLILKKKKNIMRTPLTAKEET